jgi:hypothetical protein
MAFWRYIKAPNSPTPGAMGYSLVSLNLVFNNVIGPGIGANMVYRGFAPQNLQRFSSALTTGLGGIAQGQNYVQPLSDPWNYEDSGQ